MRTYLDHNATSPLQPAARRAMLAALDAGGNASSVHAEGRAARKAVDEARETLAHLLGVSPAMIVFTSGGSEANNLALKGISAERILVSAIEHPSVLEAARYSGKAVELIPVSASGVIDLAALEALLSGSPALVSLMVANNETGALQPVQEAAALAARSGAYFHTDAVQAFGKIPIKFGLLGADLMTISAHKIGGPHGAGALIVRNGLMLEPLIHGGGQELRRRAGTENVAAIAGFAAAAAEKQPETRHMRDRLESELQEAVVFSSDVDRLPNTSCFAVPGLLAETLLMALDLEGIAISSGSACSSGKVSRSHVLAAMGVSPDLAAGAIRVSLGWNTAEEDIEHFVVAWRKIMSRQTALRAA